jgi:antitoxin FitA
MAQLVVRNVPDEVKERLKRRAKRHGRSLEAEARNVLADAPEPPPLPVDDGEGWATKLARRMAEIGVTNEDIDELDRAIAEGRKQWRTRDLGFDK